MNSVLRPRAPRILTATLLVSAALVCVATAAQAAVTISTRSTSNMTCTGGVCTPTAAKANLNVTELANMLAAGDVTVKSDSAALDIRFAAPLSWTSTSRLTLDSYHSITFETPVTVAGTGAVTITTNDGGDGGDYSFEAEGHVEFWDLNSSLIIGGHRFKLANTLAQLAEGASKKRGTGYVALAKSYDALDDGPYKKPLIKQFSGTLEGLGNHLKNFSLRFRKATEFYHLVGLIGDIGSPGLVQNLTLENATITCAIADDYVGALAARNYGTIKAVAVTGRVTSLGAGLPDAVGGIVGLSSGNILHSHSSASVKFGAWTGGLAGILRTEAGAATIVNSFSNGHVSGSANAGGLVGRSDSTDDLVIGSFATGKVDNAQFCCNTGGNVGGLLGDGRATISYSYATGDTTSYTVSAVTGGLVGADGGAIDHSFSSGAVSAEDCMACGGLAGYAVTVTDSYSTGNVTGVSTCRCGGLVGVGSSAITTSFSTGHLQSPGLVGGFIGEDDSGSGSLADNYWNLDTSGISDPSRGAGNRANDPGITGLTDSQLKSALPVGFDPETWGRKKAINNGYPYLLANPPPK